MEFDFNTNELTLNFIDKCIHSFRMQRRGEFPTRILTSVKTAMFLLDEHRNILSAVNTQPPYKMFGIKIVRCLDVDDNIIELH